MFFGRKPVVVTVNGQRVDAGGSNKPKRSWSDWLGIKMIQLSALWFTAMIVWFGVLGQ